MGENMLEIRNLCVSYPADRGVVRAVEDVSLDVPKGEIAGIVGESGCGKSTVARAVMGLIRKPGRITGGQILLDGREISRCSEKEKSVLRGAELSMIFQEPMTSLNPVIRIGRQVEEVVRLHEHTAGQAARKRVLAMLAEVGIADPEKRYNAYPHELSGGLRQRVMIAMAMICRPKLLIADEPTTALDVTVEAQILQLMRRLCGSGTSVLLISHNLGVIAQVCDRVSVMYAGRILESAETTEIFDRPTHPYTRGLLQAYQSLRENREPLDTIPGIVPDQSRLPAGCAFAPRCGRCTENCRQRMPELRETQPGHLARCFRAGEGAAV